MSSDVFEGTLGARKRTAAIWIAIGAIVVAAIIVGFVYAASTAGRSDADSSDVETPAPTPTITETPAPAAITTSIGEIADDEATTVLEAALSVPYSSVGTAADLAELLKNVASDAYAAELEAQWQELVSQGWTITGSPVVVSTDVTQADASLTPAVASVNACVDSSAVTILDATGDPIGDAGARIPRALHIFTLTQGDDAIWRISGHSFPNDPTC